MHFWQVCRHADECVCENRKTGYSVRSNCAIARRHSAGSAILLWLSSRFVVWYTLFSSPIIAAATDVRGEKEECVHKPVHVLYYYTYIYIYIYSLYILYTYIRHTRLYVCEGREKPSASRLNTKCNEQNMFISRFYLRKLKWNFHRRFMNYYDIQYILPEHKILITLLLTISF